MPIEFNGLISTRESSEVRFSAGPPIDREYTRQITRAHEDSDFDKVLIGSGSFFPEATQVAAYAADDSSAPAEAHVAKTTNEDLAILVTVCTRSP